MVARVHRRLMAQMPGVRTVLVFADADAAGATRVEAVRGALAAEFGLAADVWSGPGGKCRSFAHAHLSFVQAVKLFLSAGTLTFPYACADDGDVLLVADPKQLPLLFSACETVFIANNSLSAMDPQASSLASAGCELLAGPAVTACAVLVGARGGPCTALAEDLNSAAVAAADEAAAIVRGAGENCPLQSPNCLTFN